LIEPAVKGTVGILKSAAKVPSVKRVVITSSEVAIIPWKDFVEVESETVFTGSSPFHRFTPSEALTESTDKMSIPSPQPPYANPFEAYAASKVLALHASEEFVADSKPHFDIINIMPSIVIGANELTTSVTEMRTRGTNRYALTAMEGVKNPKPKPSTTVFVDDVAKIEVLALDPRIPGGQNFLVSSGGVEGTTWNDLIDIVRRNFPEEVARGVWPLDGDQPTKRTKVDSSRTEEVFGFKLAGYETQIKSVVKHYLELLEKA
jgi:nucleoside-diphosphate-sugar epimerase